jgi:DNA-binding XRE family transcriptional regulator
MDSKTKPRTKLWRQIREERSKLSPERRAKIDREVADQVARMKLGDLRRARRLTQETLAETMGAAQPDVSRIERNTDIYLSTLRKYVEAMGGRLHLTATFGDEEYVIGQFDDLR